MGRRLSKVSSQRLWVNTFFTDSRHSRTSRFLCYSQTIVSSSVSLLKLKDLTCHRARTKYLLAALSWTNTGIPVEGLLIPSTLASTLLMMGKDTQLHRKWSCVCEGGEESCLCRWGYVPFTLWLELINRWGNCDKHWSEFKKQQVLGSPYKEALAMIRYRKQWEKAINNFQFRFSYCKQEQENFSWMLLSFSF